MTAVNLGGVKAWDVSDQLPPGTYIMRPAPDGVERTKSSGDNEQVQVDWRVVAGEYTGAERRDWITFTENAKGRVVQLLEACGIEVPQTDFASYGELADWVAEQLRKGAVVEAVVRLKPDRKDPSKEWPEIAGYRWPSQSDIDSSAAGFQSGPKVGGGDKSLPF